MPRNVVTAHCAVTTTRNDNYNFKIGIMATCYLGLGSNVGNKKKNILLAVKYLQKSKGIKVEKVSRLYESSPCGCPAGSPDFLNGAAKIRTSLAPLALLKELKNIERCLGRKKAKRFFPRPIDIDILFYANKKVNLPNLKIPHPRLKMRDFVLTPLKEISPGIIKKIASEVKTIKDIPSMRAFLAHARKNMSIGFVPTMGYLHDGHISLIRQAKKENDVCVVSVFVNPLQFGPKEDFKKYPRDLERDSIKAQSAGCDVIFVPEERQMYPDSYCTYVNVDKLTGTLCGASRPGHFKGVATVVCKLFNIIQPDVAYFGQKDYQQALVIKAMAKDLNMPLKISIMPTVREADGLAMSSRNSYLNLSERAEAAVLYQSLQQARKNIFSGEKSSKAIIGDIRKAILKKKSAKIDYIAVADADTLESRDSVHGKALIALAAWFGKTRLIDNILL